MSLTLQDVLKDAHGFCTQTDADRPIEALVFDMDGTLVDTMPGHFQAWQNLVKRHALSFPEDQFYALGGVPTFKICRILLEAAGRTDLDPDELAEQKEAEFVQGISAVELLEPIAGIAEQNRGRLPMAVATGGYRRVAEPLLKGLGLWDWFGAVVTADDVTNHKPAPDTFLKAAEHLGVKPEHCVAFEDTDIGLKAIADAGMIGVDVRLHTSPHGAPA